MRVLSVLTFLAGAIVLWVALGILGEAPGSAPESRHLRRMKKRLAVPASYTPCNPRPTPPRPLAPPPASDSSKPR